MEIIEHVPHYITGIIFIMFGAAARSQSITPASHWLSCFVFVCGVVHVLMPGDGIFHSLYIGALYYLAILSLLCAKLFFIDGQPIIIEPPKWKVLGRRK